MALQGEEALGDAIPAKSSCGRQIGVDDLGIETDIGTGVDRQCLRAGIALHGERVRTIGAGVGQQGHLIGDDGTIALDPGFHAQNLWMARAAAAKLFGTRKFQLHRAIGSHSEDSAEVFEQDLLLDAKTTADARLDDANPTWGQANNRSDNTADALHLPMAARPRRYPRRKFGHLFTAGSRTHR